MNPDQIRMDDGFATFITFANMPTIKFYEKDVTPPGFSAGGAIDTTTMRNTAYRTMAPRKLKTVTVIKATVSYATIALDEVKAEIGVKQQITIHYPDKSTITIWGWLEEFQPSNHTDGAQPTAAIIVQPANTDLTGAEVAPLYTPPVTSS